MSRIVPKAEYPHLDKTERRLVGRLIERRDYLRRRAHEVPENAASYHREEADALDWVLGLVGGRRAS